MKRPCWRAARSVAVLSLVVAGACAIPFRKKDRHPYPKKAVTAKEGISVIVAGSARCLVSTKEFAKIKIGDQVECNWREGGASVPPV
ncbi:MAG: hypothetical protein H7Z40_17540 [Phycisphaerae bacterium]|nr:hypothetical protein [Gemmatimonadaceae bacterium]